MKIATILLAALAASCGTSSARLAPDRMDLSPWYGEGMLQRVGSPNRADSEQWGLMVTLGWDLNSDRTAAYRNLSRLEISRSGALRLSDNGSPAVTVHTGDSDEPDQQSVVSAVLEKPDTVEDAVIYIIWIAGVCLALWALKRWRFDPPKPKPEKKK